MKRAKHRRFWGAALVLAISSSSAAWAQSDPAATVAQKNQLAAAELAASGPASGDPIVADPARRAELPPPGGPTVLLKSVVFDPPSVFLSADELNAITSAYVGRTLDFSQISALVRDVNDLYATKGVVTAGAILPPQELQSGELHVQLVEGKLGNVTVVGEHRTNNKLIFDGVRLTRGDNVVDVPTAGQDILRFNKTHHAQLSMLLQPGAAFGLTDLAIGVTEPDPVTITVSADNLGSASTGELQASASVRTFGLLGIDDSLLIHGTASEGSMAGTVNFDMPLSPFGTRVALGVTGSTIKVIAGPTEPLDITGQSANGTVTITQALLARADLTVIGLVSGSYGLSQSFSGATQLVNAGTTKASIGASVSYTSERFSISAQPQLIYALADNRMDGTQRGVTIVAGSFDASVVATEQVRLETRGAWQYSPDVLLPGSLLFQIGGPGTVRGFPSDGVSGDSGYFIQNEVHWTPPESPGLDLYALADIGTVFSTFPPSTTMVSVGAGLSYAWENGASADLSVAVPLAKSVDDQGDFAIYGKVAGSFH